MVSSPISVPWAGSFVGFVVDRQIWRTSRVSWGLHLEPAVSRPVPRFRVLRSPRFLGAAELTKSWAGGGWEASGFLRRLGLF